MKFPPEKLSKLEAARRQLRQAIHLFLSGGDMIAVHTLAAASLQVLVDLGVKSGMESMVKNPKLIRPEKRKYVADKFSEAQNFFKHADRDPDEILDFFPEATPFYIVDAVVLYEHVSGSSTHACKAFHVWFSLNYPDVLIDGEYKKYIERVVSADPALADREVANKLLLHLEQNDI
jgi:hypothetical protein